MTISSTIQSILPHLPDNPGVYLYYDNNKELIYVGKATNLKSRVSSYFRGQKSPRPIEEMIDEVADIKWLTTDSVIEAIILEANYIKKFLPKYNVLGRDDKSWNYIIITKDVFPKILFIRAHDLRTMNEKEQNKKIKCAFGPYPGLNTVAMLKILRRLFYISTCEPNQKRACLYFELGECLGVCNGEINAIDYKRKVIAPLLSFLSGKKLNLLKTLKKRMTAESTAENFEESARLRDQINALNKIRDIALINRSFVEDDLNKTPIKIEGYDISNLGKTGKVGSLVAFDENGPLKNEYKKFKIYSVVGQSDVDCLDEILTRRLKHADWPLPDIFLIDGGLPQVNVAKSILTKFNINITIVGIAKGPTRKKNVFIIFPKTSPLAAWVKTNEKLLINVRDEAHRFAIKYQRQTRKI